MRPRRVIHLAATTTSRASNYSSGTPPPLAPPASLLLPRSSLRMSACPRFLPFSATVHRPPGETPPTVQGVKHPGRGAGTRLSLKALIALARLRSLSLISCFARCPLSAARCPSAIRRYLIHSRLGIRLRAFPRGALWESPCSCSRFIAKPASAPHNSLNPSTRQRTAGHLFWAASRDGVLLTSIFHAPSC
jgi:hypothetical protein